MGIVVMEHAGTAIAAVGERQMGVGVKKEFVVGVVVV
jgi:hypothetical protein